jgi:glutathionyl-hydroquinone reductase
MSHPHINPTRIVPAGPRLKFMAAKSGAHAGLLHS